MESLPVVLILLGAGAIGTWLILRSLRVTRRRRGANKRGPVKSRVITLAGDEQFGTVVVSNNRQQIVDLGAAKGANFVARLLPSASGRGAVCVEIEGKQIGYLSQIDGVLYRERMEELGLAGQTASCRAKLKNRRSQPPSIWLDLAWPPSPTRGAEGHAASKRFPKRGQKTARPVKRFRWLIAAGGAAALFSFAVLSSWLSPAFRRESPESTSVKLCREYPEEARLAWEIVAGDAALVRDATVAARVLVQEGAWNQLALEDKRRIGNAAFCRVMTPEGAGTVKFVGATSGQVLATVADGNWVESD